MKTAPLALDGYAVASVEKVLGSRLRCGALALDALPQDRTTKVLLCVNAGGEHRDYCATAPMESDA